MVNERIGKDLFFFEDLSSEVRAVAYGNFYKYIMSIPENTFYVTRAYVDYCLSNEDPLFTKDGQLYEI